MTNIYLDNASTTPLDEEVKNEMIKAMEHFGNASSTHNFGRKAKIIIEKTRTLIARELNCATGEIFFTSGGTEADNMALTAAVRDLGVERIVTSPIEHHAVLHTVKFLENSTNIEVCLLPVSPNGEVDLDALILLLEEDKTTLVSLMYANNEIGNLLDFNKVAQLAKLYGAYFHSDTVQAIGHFKLDLQKTPVDFIACAAHKFHGPKGVGFVFVRGGVKVNPMLHGGGQERNLRAGTENVIGIAGLAKAFEIAYKNLDTDRQKIIALKTHFITRIKEEFPEISFNGFSDDLEKSNYTVVNLSIAKTAKSEQLLFNMDMKGIAVSGGSACNSGAAKGSHVIEEIKKGSEPIVAVRVSFSKLNTLAEINYFLDVLKEMV